MPSGGTNFINVLGSTFTKLTVLERLPNTEYGCVLWKCQCACGNIRAVLTKDLRSGHTKSCGCSRAYANKRRSKPGSMLRQLMWSYRNNADKRNVQFSLTEKQFEVFVQGDCYYCGAPPSRIFGQKKIKYVCTGIDRVNNAIGYTVDNCVSCCKVCNIFKRRMSKDEMLDFVKRIYQRHCEVSR